MVNSRQSVVRNVLSEMDCAEKYLTEINIKYWNTIYTDMFFDFDPLYFHDGDEYEEEFYKLKNKYPSYDLEDASKNVHIKNPLIKKTIEGDEYDYDIEIGRVIWELYSSKGTRRVLEFSNDGIIKYDGDDYNASFDVDSNDFDLSIPTKYIIGGIKFSDRVIISYKNNKYKESLEGITVSENFSTGEYKATIEPKNRKGKVCGMFVFEYSKKTGVKAYFCPRYRPREEITNEQKDNKIDLINEPRVVSDNENTVLAALKRYIDDQSVHESRNNSCAANKNAMVIIDEISKMEPGEERAKFINKYIRDVERKIIDEVNNVRSCVLLNGLRNRINYCMGYFKNLHKKEEIKANCSKK